MTARDVARAVLRRVEQGEAYATLALGGALGRARLGPADRALATELVYGALRHRTRLDRALAAQAPRGLGGLSAPARIALRVAAYQILELRVPAHAAVDDAVEAVKATAGARVAGFANAVLRKLADRGEPPPPAGLEARLEQVHSLPAWIASRLIGAVGTGEAEAAAAALNQPAPLALRVALRRAGRDQVAARIRSARPDAEIAPSPDLPEALLVARAGALDELPPFQEGLVTAQDVAAQLVGRLVGAAPGERILDACAGVGGKSTHLAELAGDAAAVDAADVSRQKLDLAEDTARRLGLRTIRAVAADLTDPAAPLADRYDRVLLDAPCSGLGVLRRHPEGKWRRRPDEIPALAALQARLLDALAPRVRPGGVLVYSVCTFTDEEGPAQVARFRAAHPEFGPAPPPPDVDWTRFLDAGAVRTFPHRHGTDAFFAVRLLRAT
jgi:16S rRNA (cytosine967-C5)-methyltransferase